jgi:L-ascorbate metabolism protein UlaG (beta-lactamase superfamily)
MRYLVSVFCALLAAGLLACSAPGTARQAGGVAATPQTGDGREITRLELPAGLAATTTGGSVQFIGTATVLLRYGGLTILTDPNFLHKGDHVHLGYGLHSQRLTDPAIEFDNLPPIDLVILSHMHEDHFDKLVQQKLKRDTPIVTTPEASEELARLGFTRTIALSRWAALDVSKGPDRLRVAAMPGRHGGPVSARLLPTVMGSMLEFSSSAGAPAYRMYISGDTLVYDDIAEIPRRYPNIDLALLHLGGTRILGVVKVTMDGKDGVRMLQLVAPRHAIPIHYNDYDVFKSPLSDFQREVAAAGLTGKVVYLNHGDTYQFVPATP